MRIAVNTRLLLKDRLEGIGWFTYEVFRRLVRDHPEHEFFFFFDRPYDASFVFGENVRPLVLPPPARHPVLFPIWFEGSVRRALARYQPDVFVSPDGYLCLSTSVKSLPVIHDLNFEAFPQDLPFLVRKYYRSFFPRFARKAERIVTVSEFSRQDITARYGVSPRRIDVVYNGVNPAFVPLEAEEKEKVRQQWTEGAPYLLFVGALHPRKNITRMLQAFDAFRATVDKPFRLLLAGEIQWWTGEMQAAYTSMRYRDEVIFAGHLTTEGLTRVVGAASAMVYISYYEGFGIPPLEAMRCGVPVLAGDATAIPEVVGEGALLVDPFSLEAIREGMLTLVRDRARTEQLVKKGMEQSGSFTWDRTAKAMMASILKTVDHG